MRNRELELTPTAKAIIIEISEALQRFVATGETWSIFTNKMALTPEDRQLIRDFLGQGSIKINLPDSAEPAEWMESGISGIWYGVFYDHSHNPILETIEIGAFPQVASAQKEDITLGIEKLKQDLV